MSSKKNSNIFAVIVGIGNYQDPSISNLKYTHADAEAFASLLLNSERCGIPEEQVKLLLDEDATCFNIKDAVSDWLYNNAKEDSTIIIFFAGHGGSENKNIGGNEISSKYLLPWDTKLKNLYASAISCLTFNDLLERVNAKRKVIFMDACYSGGIAKPGARDLDIIENPYSNLGDGQGTIVVAASQPHQKSWEYDEIGHGIFTYHLLEALNGAADADANGEITVWEVVDYLKKTVPVSAQKYVNEHQVPYWRGEGFGDIKLTINAKIIEELSLRNNKEYQEKRIKILNYYKQMPQTYIDDALELIKKDKSALTEFENNKAKFLDLLIREDITVQQYLRLVTPVEELVKDLDRGADKKVVSRNIVEGKKASLKFCIKCGAKIIAGTKFCISCGNRLSDLI